MILFIKRIINNNINTQFRYFAIFHKYVNCYIKRDIVSSGFFFSKMLTATNSMSRQYMVSQQARQEIAIFSRMVVQPNDLYEDIM